MSVRRCMLVTMMALSCVQKYSHTHTHTPSLSTTVMTDALGEPISAKSGLPTEVIISVKYSDSSVELSSMVDIIKVADI